MTPSGIACMMCSRWRRLRLASRANWLIRRNRRAFCMASPACWANCSSSSTSSAGKPRARRWYTSIVPSTLPVWVMVSRFALPSINRGSTVCPRFIGGTAVGGGRSGVGSKIGMQRTEPGRRGIPPSSSKGKFISGVVLVSVITRVRRSRATRPRSNCSLNCGCQSCERRCTPF